MGSLEKLSEMLVAVKGKKDGVFSAMNQQVLELKELEGCFEKVLEGFQGCFTEIQSKELHLEGPREEIAGGSCVDGFLENHELQPRIEAADSVVSVYRRREEELNSREKELEEMERVLEERQTVMFSEEAKLVRREDQVDKKLKMLEFRSFELDSKQRLLVKREKAMRSEAGRMAMKKSELHLKESKLEDLAEELQAKERTINRKMKLITEEQEASSASPVEVRMIGRKRSVHSILGKSDDDGIEMVESSFPDVKRGSFRTDRRFQPYDRENPGFVRSVLGNQQRCLDGLSFVVAIAPVHEERSYLTVPAKFVAVYDLSKKESVILVSNEGSFQLQVKHFEDPRRVKSLHVTFRRGWRTFYSRNNLRIGMVCLFRVKEHNVDGNDSTFSMNVSFLTSERLNS